MPFKCIHHWRDFPWFTKTFYDDYSQKLTIEVVESYICIHCKERKDVVLGKHVYFCLTEKLALEKIKEYEDQFKDKIKPKEIVEDMINDMQLVDRHYLEIYDQIHQH